MANPLLDSLKQASLLPSRVLNGNFTPTVEIKVAFPSGKHISNGTLVRVSEVKEAPIVSITSLGDSTAFSSLSGQKFTFMLIDPDAPTPDDPKFAYWRHWVVVNIPFPSDAAESDSNSTPRCVTTTGRTLTQYLAPGPKDESGPHRYLFLLFREPEQGLLLEKADVGGEEFVQRRSFRAEEFVKKHGLELVGVQWMRGVGDGWKGEE
ncbi:phosphatidylethanolamine-binding protein [Chaetomium strumarium]|uniref:Phosphatidylethanolamine-binding protein n=1 Tax=Chaetomium strumarium TaxID=1170767 RepID=A0AAJ0M7H8_9PEZI|nr:phosphatidylethanolamine-binding protein [Chaetomium strumarium]